MNKYLVFSHGFGVKKDSRGMFTDIAQAFPEYKSIMFNYNDINELNNEVIVHSLFDQAKLLHEHIDTIQENDASAQITLICHSQGCVAAAIAHADIHKAILLTPPDSVSSARFNDHFAKRDGVVVEDNGTIRVPRKDGSNTRITKDYIDSLSKINALELYAKLGSSVPTSIIVAKEDEMLRPIDFSGLPENITILTIDGDHNFTGVARTGIIKTLKELL